MINGNIYKESVRYFQNASDILKNKAKKEGRYYQDAKYVRSWMNFFPDFLCTLLKMVNQNIPCSMH